MTDPSRPATLPEYGAPEQVNVVDVMTPEGWVRVPRADEVKIDKDGNLLVLPEEYGDPLFCGAFRESTWSWAVSRRVPETEVDAHPSCRPDGDGG